jgi:site-specific DNA recombinase
MRSLAGGGSPVVGACLSRKHRYYRCRSTSPTAAKGKTCNARYIRADYIEDVVWENIKKVLEHPEVIIAELKRQSDERSKLSLQEPDLNQEIINLGKRLRSYEKQERRLILLLRINRLLKTMF